MSETHLEAHSRADEPLPSPRPSRPMASPIGLDRSPSLPPSPSLSAKKKKGGRKIMLSPRGSLHSTKPLSDLPPTSPPSVVELPADTPTNMRSTDTPELPSEVVKPFAPKRRPVARPMPAEEVRREDLPRTKSPLVRLPSRVLPFSGPSTARGSAPAAAVPLALATAAQLAQGVSARAYGRGSNQLSSFRSGGQSARSAPALEGMTLVQLCELKQLGMFSDEEFTVLKVQLLADL
ncbi:hypothetical protein T492DRAFT_984979 [Pavlovales sp. CCMP2436]|nr:hypothetical protein T492DRAFT_984979 [Pavlovales sp. CCMP2436]|mmetsp:Transcript_45049/g.111637  ORF Transcript_45049/g.111637 Transcript_45049/m.111637 type:complete len:235 (+) Transcript_45049:98-802(+)